MKITLDTENKTISVDEPIKIVELMKFVNKNNAIDEEWEIISNYNFPYVYPYVPATYEHIITCDSN